MDKNKAIDEANKCSLKLSLAQRLVSALSSEKGRWRENILSLEKMIQNVVGDVLLSASFISYAGPFSKHYREILVKNELMNFIMKRSIPKTADIGPIEFLVDEAVKA